MTKQPDDSLFWFEVEVEVEDEQGNDPDYEAGICPACNGSGEGYSDGSRCNACKGKGEI